jgi:hypothetical protein
MSETESQIEIYVGDEEGLLEISGRESTSDHVEWLWSKTGQFAVIKVLSLQPEEGIPSHFDLKAPQEMGQEVFEHPYSYFFRAVGQTSLGKGLVRLGHAA